MWQRIQTLYLLVSTGLVASLLFCEKAGGVRFTAYPPYVILTVIILLLNILAISVYRFRIFQMRTAVLSAIIALALQAWLAVDFFTADKTLVFHVTAVFPLAVVILNFLAARNIYADELIVRSASRLRSAKRGVAKKKQANR